MMLSEAVDWGSIKDVSDNYWGTIIMLNSLVMIKTRQGVHVAATWQWLTHPFIFSHNHFFYSCNTTYVLYLFNVICFHPSTLWYRSFYRYDNHVSFQLPTHVRLQGIARELDVYRSFVRDKKNCSVVIKISKMRYTENFRVQCIIRPKHIILHLFYGMLVREFCVWIILSHL